ncbi:TonB-dependent receptor domain-containing protein [Prolixibacter sp. NT017]|uniref:TonB-dependent receptor n=1 Tax=Prolixibacter sp. NT017 TaxID=2652390 RepID=UPI001289F15F|nr:TonB-dependent receptor [Prolixibacter sp. NT017]GET25412.1 TonB-dependent receptor [Prolixibacter sp. NT017]
MEYRGTYFNLFRYSLQVYHMSHLRNILLILLFFYQQVDAQKYATISGYIRDSISSENLNSATIYNLSSLQGTLSNNYGFYSLRVPTGKVSLFISYVGYQPQHLNLAVQKDTTIDFRLSSQNEIQQIKVSAKNKNLDSSLPGHQHITMQSIEALPGFLGEQDVLKSLTILPGVQQGHEGSAGIFVRGGSPDQNLILLDGVPVFNASHLFGFVSVFTPEALQSVDFYKGGFPVRYGGRLSSVIDVRMKEGNKNKQKTNLTFGIISSKFTHEGPIKKGKSSYLISARRTLLDVLVTGAAKINKQSSDDGAVVPGLNFYDFNLKFNFDLNKKNRLYFSFYTGGDRMFSRFFQDETFTGQEGREITSEQRTKVDLRWGNKIGAIRWNSQVGNKLFLNTTLSSGLFQYTIHNNYRQIRTEANKNEKQQTDIRYNTLVNNNKLQFLFDWYLTNQHKIQFGSNAEVNGFVPGKQEISRNDETPFKRGNGWTSNKALALFADDHWTPDEKLTIYGGLRYDFYLLQGEWFTYLQPRVSLCFAPSPKYSINLSYDEMAQPIHLLTNSSIGLPSDIWVPAIKNVPPEYSTQIALGINTSVNNHLNYSFDSYYKTMKGVINYKAGYSFMDIYKDWGSLVETGTGRAWGFEQHLNYEKNQLKGWLNYTLSWNRRKFASINNGQPFPFKFDRRHDINVGLIYKLSEKTELSAVWTFQSGTAATIPQINYQAAGPVNYTITDFITGKDVEDPARIQYIDNYNGSRLPAFHHLDIGLTFKKQRTSYEREWKIGVYNVYARQNPYMYYPYTAPNGYQKYRQISIFPFLPSISYHIQF